MDGGGDIGGRGSQISGEAKPNPNSRGQALYDKVQVVQVVKSAEGHNKSLSCDDLSLEIVENRGGHVKSMLLWGQSAPVSTRPYGAK